MKFEKALQFVTQGKLIQKVDEEWVESHKFVFMRPEWPTTPEMVRYVASLPVDFKTYVAKNLKIATSVMFSPYLCLHGVYKDKHGLNYVINGWVATKEDQAADWKVLEI